MPGTRYVALALLALLALLPPSQPSAAQGARWQTGDQLPTYCVDATRPSTMLLSTFGSTGGPLSPGTYAFNWATGERALLAGVAFTTCNPANGLLYGGLPATEARPEGQAVLFSSSSPQPAVIDRMPTHHALDGSLWAYALDASPADGARALWASPDGGRSWLRRALPSDEPLFGMTVAPADGRAIYLLAGSVPWADTATPYTIFFSPDAGATWERRGSGAFSDTPSAPQLRIGSFDSAATPVGTVLISAANGDGGRYESHTRYLSTDGGRTFAGLAAPGDEQGGPMSYGPTTQVYHTRDGLLRLRAEPRSSAAALDRSADGGASWEPLPLPFAIHRDFYNGIFMLQAFAAPDVLALLDSDRVWQLTTDGGRSWRPMEGVSGIAGFTHSLPMRALTVVDGEHLLRDLPGAERSVVGPAAPKDLPDGAFFPETGHSLGGAFRRYWERNGGLPIFGLPISEPFRELNPADGRVYLVQYFERNRFEYHPDLAGTPHEVQLGLLGTQALDERGWRSP